MHVFPIQHAQYDPYTRRANTAVPRTIPHNTTIRTSTSRCNPHLPTPTPIYCHTHTRRYHPPAHLHHVNTLCPLCKPQRHTATPCPATMAPNRPSVTPRPFVRTERSPSPRPDTPAEATLTGGSPGPTPERADLGTPTRPCTFPHASRTPPAPPHGTAARNASGVAGAPPRCHPPHGTPAGSTAP